jgi:hypothetical protein
MRLDLPARPPFSLGQVIHGHGWPQLLPFQWDRASNELRRVDRLPSGAVVEMQFHAAEGGLSVELVDPPGALSDADRRALVEAAFKDWGRWKALAYLFWEWSER